MSDTLTTDDIAGMLADTHARSYLVNGVRTTTLTTECLEMVLREILSLRAEIRLLRGDTGPRHGGGNSEGI